MITVRNLRGFSLALFRIRLKSTIFFHSLPALLDGSLSPRRFILFLKRLLLFLSKLDHNKFTRLGSGVRMDLYLPSFPTRAFYTSCRKFMSFEGPLPCTTVLISVTSACRFSCPHCYQARDHGKDLPVEKLLPVIRKLQDHGIAFFNIEGGEPFLAYDRLKQVCATIDRRSEIWVNSTGDGMTPERLRELKQLNLTAIMFSLHTADRAKLNAFMGSEKAWDILQRGVELCHAAEVPVAFNTCLGPEGFHDGEFERILEQAKRFGGCILQLIKPKPSGRWLEPGAAEFSREDLARVAELVRRYNHGKEFAEFPGISCQILEEDRERFGCTAGGTDRFYINAKGDVQPCEFLNLSFGNIATEEFETIYARMRRAFAPPCDAWLCEACAPQIRDVVRSRNITSLPLSPERSREICTTWVRGKPTPVYAELERLR